MSRKKQNIKIQMYIEGNLNHVFNSKEIHLFWESKMEDLIRKNGVNKKDLLNFHEANVIY